MGNTSLYEKICVYLDKLSKKENPIDTAIRKAKIYQPEIFSDYFVKGKPKNWFFSEEAKRKLESANTFSEKMDFFTSYLNLMNENINECRKIAFILTEGVYGKNIPFGTYPEILDPAKNPLIKRFDNTISAKYYVEYVINDMHGSKVVDFNKNVFTNIDTIILGNKDLDYIQLLLISFKCESSPMDMYDYDDDDDYDEE